MNLKAPVFVNIHAVVEGNYDGNADQGTYISTGVTIVNVNGVPVIIDQGNLSLSEINRISEAMVADTLRAMLKAVEERMKQKGVEKASIPQRVPEGGVLA